MLLVPPFYASVANTVFGYFNACSPNVFVAPLFSCLVVEAPLRVSLSARRLLSLFFIVIFIPRLFLPFPVPGLCPPRPHEWGCFAAPHAPLLLLELHRAVSPSTCDCLLFRVTQALRTTFICSGTPPHTTNAAWRGTLRHHPISHLLSPFSISPLVSQQRKITTEQDNEKQK